MANPMDILGNKYGRLTVMQRASNTPRGETRWLCRCDCGKEKEVLGRYLISGRTKSCGCYKSEATAEFNRRTKKKHGDDEKRLINIWTTMKQRCGNKNAKDYPRYGGRGITICEAWLESFEAFRDWALANGYRDDLTLDREDNDGPYSPENCRWTDTKTQNNNQRSNIRIEHNGENRTIAEWAKTTGVDYALLYNRLKRGWTFERSITEKKRRTKNEH